MKYPKRCQYKYAKFPYRNRNKPGCVAAPGDVGTGPWLGSKAPPLHFAATLLGEAEGLVPG
jgi:hypothetical protein